MPPFPSLPEERVTRCRPYERCGLVYTGSFTVRTYSGRRKVWIAMFTCMVMWRINLETVLNMTTESFLKVVRRFMARCSVPKMMFSDSALQFKLAEKALKRLINDITQVINYAASERIYWSFNVPYASWSGGHYERFNGIPKDAEEEIL
ncbi:hypothetical protein L596_030826 [Steinernema carpocapsae]|uniref:Integrase catalytic domain-containing protein n=1 Tax=Steinernema carpocapsae TaxID=34508 RepID=A0A4U5LN78_STECR|nr:hypothetical protein L596_030826 [Steinernema carpocapsae]